MYLREDALSGMSYLDNQSEVRAPTAEVAARLLDAAIAARTVPREFFLPRDDAVCRARSITSQFSPSIYPPVRQTRLFTDV